MLKVGIITPYGGDDPETLARCCANVDTLGLDGLEVHHYVVRDGPSDDGSFASRTVATPSGARHWTQTTERAGDAGATPRAIGSVEALGAGRVDVLCFLDADNLLEPDHLPRCLSAAESAPIVTTLRYICDPRTMKEFAVGGAEPDDYYHEEVWDTNCLMLSGVALNFAATWAWRDMASVWTGNTGADRSFWMRLKRSIGKESVACTNRPTVRYASTWLAHYNAEGAPEPPDVCSVMVRSGDGRVKIRVRPTTQDESGRWQFAVDDPRVVTP
jgi:hypothetical protein